MNEITFDPVPGCPIDRRKSASSDGPARFSWSWSLLLMCFCVLFGAGSALRPQAAWAQAALISAKISSSSPPVRSGAPVSITWNLASQASGILEGRLEIIVRDGQETLAHLESDDMALAPGDQFVRTVLPPLEADNAFGSGEIQLRFVGPRQTFDLGSHFVLLKSNWQRSFVIAVCHARLGNLADTAQVLLRELRFEAYNPNAADRTITTTTAELSPDDLPTEPLLYCSFDLVVLTPEAFSSLKDAQLRAILEWVDAGGSLCIIPGREVLQVHHLAFLNRFSVDQNGPAFQVDRSGRLMPPETDESSARPPPAQGTAPPAKAPFVAPATPLADLIKGRLDAGKAPQDASPTTATRLIFLKRWGLGRVAVIRGDLATPGDPGPLNNAELRRAVAFLWKFCQNEIDSIVADGKWQEPLPATPAGNPGLAQSYEEIARLRPSDMQLAPIALQTGDQLLAHLMPRDLRIVPMGLLWLMLFVYVLVIGPGDYFLLGAFRRRRYTWLVFPATTVAFAAGTIAFSNWYMSVSDNRRSVTIFDVGSGGKIARSNRFEALFHSTQATHSTDVSRGLFTAMQHQRFSRGSWFTYQQAMARGDEDRLDLVGIPDYSGRVPAQFQVTQRLPQWTPQLNRLMAIAPKGESVSLDWNALAPLGAPVAAGVLWGPSRQAIVAGVQTAFGRDATVFVATGTDIHCLAGDSTLLQKDSIDLSAGYQAQSLYYPPGIYPGSRRASTFLADIASQWSTGGLFAAVSQISPTGGKDFEDLALLDTTDPRQWLLIVIVQRGDDLSVYRRLYTGEP